ncbi:hypothetical protein [Endozoicomonas sp. ONNA2]|uniref:hypothetical protein n=1 Tax=Endozoicomonas sp. ONNA2 TaxID=2828741 RepID=UPI0021487AE4|nr:hypothetical protein [Endozoicomonas sp. ONNA2]
MNTGNIATGLAGVGLAAAFSLNSDSGSSPLTMWRNRVVMAFASTVGTSLSLVQCLREGRNVSARTAATLATNASVLAYSYLQPWVDITKELPIYRSEANCYEELLKNKGETSIPQCQRFLQYFREAVAREKMQAQLDRTRDNNLKVTIYDWTGGATKRRYPSHSY